MAAMGREVEVVAVTATVADPVAGSTDGEPIAHVTFAGALHAKENDPRKFAIGAALTEKLACWPTGTVTLEGVGCAQTMCSRVRAGTVEADGVWLDDLDRVRLISDE